MALLNASKRHALLIFTFLCIDLAGATSSEKLTSRDVEVIEGTLNCETDRSSDYYGLGVRIGIYFAWMTAWIANICVPSEISTAQDTNAIFLFAILVSMVRCTVSKLLLQMDGVMLMHMGGGTIFSVLSIWGYRTCTYDIEGPKEGIRKFGGWGTHFRLLLSMGISTFGLFFWAWGIEGALDPDPDPACQVVYTFMFSKQRADGGIRIFYIIVCICCMLYFGIMLLASLVAVPTRLRRSKRARKEGDTGERLRHKFATGLTQKQLRQIFYFLRIGNFIFIVYSMLLIEFTLNYNSVAGVLGRNGHIFFPSQIIPMIIGAFSFCRVIWVRYIEWKAPDYLNPTTRPRTILKPNPKELIRMYTPKSNLGMEFVNKRPDGDMDPLMQGQSVGLKLLISWLPWLAVLRWWKPEGQQSQQEPKDPEKLKPANSGDDGWSSDSTPKVGEMQHRDTWGSDQTAADRLGTELPEVPKNIARFGSLRG